MKYRPLLALLLLVATLRPAAATSVNEPLKLVVIVAVDGLSWPRLDGYRPWYEAGLKRLLNESQVQTACFYRHLNTETGPGHASLGTGAPPRVHGIVANRWLEPDADGAGLHRVYCADQLPPAAAGPPALRTLGAANLRVPTLGDRLVQAHPTSRVVALSGKDRGAVFLAGKDPRHAVFWSDWDSGNYVTSAAYAAGDAFASTARDVVKQFNAKQAGDHLTRRFGTVWRSLPEPPHAAGTQWPLPEPDLARFQFPDIGLGFPHDLTLDSHGYFAAFHGTPFQDQLLTDLALVLLADPGLALGRRNTSDLLALSYSAHDLVSHDFGSESAEELDALRRLDIELGRLLDALSALAAAEPKGRVVLALSADHGFTPLPEVVRRREGKRLGGRLLDSESSSEAAYPSFHERMNRALSDELCLPPGSTALRGESWNLYYDPLALATRTVAGPCGEAGRSITAADLDRVLPTVVRRLYGEEIADVLLISERHRWPSANPAVPFAQNNFDAERAGSAFLVPRRYVSMVSDAERGAGHGSPYDYDTHVPLLFWGAPFAAGETAEDCTPYDLAPTLADVLGIHLPEATGVSRVRSGQVGR
jgi:arylsulfatase A-like enzyme